MKADPALLRRSVSPCRPPLNRAKRRLVFFISGGEEAEAFECPRCRRPVCGFRGSAATTHRKRTVEYVVMASPEHQAIAEAIDSVLHGFGESGLVGVFEGQRRTFDYSCLLARDLERPLVAQVLWQHEHGLDKDIRTLLFDTEALIKLYVIRNSTRVRATLDDILVSYRQDPSSRRSYLASN